MSDLPVIAGIEITTDAEGRFNLNALHRASGGEKKDGPSYWLALDTTKAIVSECAKQICSDTEIPVSLINIVKGGDLRNGSTQQGTFAHKLLAISYAGWISPAFQLQVNQVFLDYKTGNLNPSIHQSASLTPVNREFKAALSLAKAIGFKGNQAVLSANKAIRKRMAIDCLELLEATHLIADQQDVLLTITEIGQRLGLPTRQVNPMLETLGLQKGYRDHKNRQQWEITEEGLRYGVYQDTGKRHSDGAPVRQIRWNGALVSQLQKSITVPLVEVRKTH